MPRTHHQGLHDFIVEHVAGRKSPSSGQGGRGGGGRLLTPAMRMGIRVANQVSAHLKWAAGTAAERPPELGGKHGAHARAILAAFRRWQWVPVPAAEQCVAEVPALVRPWCLATKVDALMYCRRTGRLVVIEIKNGVAGARRSAFEGAGHARFAAPFAHVADTPLNRASVQALMGLAMIKRDPRYAQLVERFAGKMAVFVVRCTGASVRPYLVADAWCVDLVNHHCRVLEAAGPRRIRDTLAGPAARTDDVPASPASAGEVVCPITQCALVDPVAVPCCGNLFTRTALEEALRYNPTCPLCRTDLSAHIAAAAEGE